MPDPITYAEAAALAQRLDRAREQGALLLLCRQEVRGFEFHPERGRIYIRVAIVAPFFGPDDNRTPAEFEAHWQGRITLHGWLPWPTGEAVTADDLYRLLQDTSGRCLVELERAEAWPDEYSPDGLRELAESAERLAQVCRALATETGER